jgi:PAS domain S-box-containing protein
MKYSDKDTRLRKSGMDLIGDVAWGTHLGQFYQTKQDLLDILAPYFKTGLEHNEFCLWVTAEPLGVEEARAAMRKAMPGFEEYIRQGQIEIIPYKEWYTLGGVYDKNRVLTSLVSKLNTALERGFEGLRLTGNAFWIEKEDWQALTDYEATVNNVIGNYKMLAICTYSLDRCGTNEIIDVIINHRFALIKRSGKWEIIQSTEQKKIMDALRRSEKRYRSYIRLTGQLEWTTNAAGEVVGDIPLWSEYTGQSYEEIKGWGWSKAVHPDDIAHIREAWRKAVREKSRYESEYRIRRQDGIYRHFLARGIPVFDETGAIHEWVGTCIDITERKQAEAALRESEEKQKIAEALQAERQRLFDVLETLPVMICLLTPDHHVTFSNRAFREKFGESDGRHCYEYCFGSEKPCDFCESYKVLETGKSHRWEFTTPDSKSIINVYDFPFTNVDGSPLILEMGLDITEWRQAEKALKDLNDTLEQRVIARTAALGDSKERLNRSQEIAHLGSWELDLVKNHIFWSDEVYRIFGLKPQEFGATYEAFLEAVHPDDRAAVDAAYSGSLREGRDSYEIEHRVVRKSTGEVRMVHEKCEHKRDASGKIIKSVGMVHDITERKEAEKKVSRLASFPELNTNPIVELDLSGNPTFINSAANILFPDLKIKGLNHPYLSGFLPIAEYFKKEQKSITTREIKVNNNWFNQNFHYVTDFNCIRIYGMDITQLKQAEEALKRSNENLEQFAYVASHDLQEPLRIMASYSQLLASRYQNKLDADAHDFIGYIVDAARRMQKLISDLLAYSRVGRLDTGAEEVDCNTILGKVIYSLNHMIDESQAIITHDPLPVSICHEMLFIQLFQNLISNAIKFRGNDPPRIHISAKLNNSEWVFSVRDNGIGIEDRYKEKIFQIFQRLHGRDKYSGTGIGLSICKKIVETYGGQIWVESEPGRGATFYFTIPATVVK